MKKAQIKVSLIDFTGAGSDDPQYRAARLLAFTKNTRLNMNPDGFQKFLDMPMEELEEELAYISNTIPTAWEFANATFCIEGVSRACAQQITRTRWTPMESDMFGSYQMQSQRVTDVSEAACHIPDELSEGNKLVHEIRLGKQMAAYSESIEEHGNVEAARGLLPMAVSCNLIMKTDLRLLSEMCKKRKSLRVAGEFNEVVKQMRELTEAQWPWSSPFFEPKDNKAIALIESVAVKLGQEDKMTLAKAADMLKV